MKKVLFLLLAATLFVASSAFAQVTFIGTFMDKKGAKINGLIAVLDIPGGSLAGKGEIKDGQTAIKFPLDTEKAFRGKIRLRVFGVDKTKTQYNLIDPKGVAVKEQIYAFYFDPMKRTPTTQYLSADARIVVSSREAKPFKVDLPATTTTTSKTAAPTFNPAGGTYTSTKSVVISSGTSGATIRYTTDGSNPTQTSGTVYSGTITVSSTKTIKAIAYKSGWQPSSVASATYTITLKVAAPTFAPSGGAYSSIQIVTLSCATPGATIRYTTDGSNPTSTTGTAHAGGIALSDATTTTIKAIASKSGWQPSSVASATYTITLKVAAPTLSPSGRTFILSQTVILSCATSDTTIRYTTDGSNPTTTSGTAYSGAITLSNTTTIKAIAYKSGWQPSSVASATYTLASTELIPK